MKELTVRGKYAGEPIANHVSVLDGGGGQTNCSRVTILVHGFNVREEVARQVFKSYEEKLKQSLGNVRFGLLGEICSFHWPGDHSRNGFSRLTFAARIQVARTCGERLADYIATLAPHQEVMLVAHSLGGQVVLKALECIRHMVYEGRYLGPRVTHTFLMAAAVPVEMCESDGPWSEQVGEEHVFYSNRDLVLKYFFGVGSNLYVKSGLAAVGQRGEPTRNRWSTRHKTFHGHGDYWDSATVAGAVAITVMGSNSSRLLPAWQISDGSGGPFRVESRRLTPRFLPERKRK